MKPNEYQCSMCRGVFEKARSDEEAYAETKELFGATPDDIPCAIVCDDCFNAMNDIIPISGKQKREN